ncbi:ABC transporter substrate-binding protein [Jeotgalibacillus soli]|uniref:Sugar ABC transporter substrate-binding protein n=1 Tax=Jeotgalibacillus soli TaxID=889306 RepID=A0A0C2VT88_9BACL|nr:sugar ABC transporter substrate-binding protein [Jeotgalibacillus soli]KIL52142.1 sugar ABC transporter substrate-binding protein [Jeotgalibacillus soli]
MKKKWLLSGLALLLLLLTACSGGSDSSSSSSDAGSGSSEDGDDITLRIAWWGSQTRHDMTLEVIEMYEEQNPNVTIESEFTGWDGYFEKMSAQAVGNNLPDIMQMNFGEYLNQYADKNLLADLSEFVDEGVIDANGISPELLDSGVVDGKLLGIPLGMNALTVVYDEEMLTNAGTSMPEDWTWDDFEAAATAVHEELDVYGTRLFEIDNIFEYYLRTHDARFFNDDGTDLGYTDDQLLIDYFTMNKNLVDEGIAPGFDVVQQIKGIEDELIVHGNAPFDLRWSNQVVALSSAAGRPLKLAMLPGPNTEEGMFLKPASFFSVTESSEQKEEAAKFLDFFTNSIEANKILNAERGIPVDEEVREELAAAADENNKAIYDYIDLVGENSSPVDKNYPASATEIITLLTEVDEKVMYGQITPEEGAKEFREKAKEILAR